MQTKPLDELLDDQADEVAIDAAVDDALNAGCLRIQDHLGVKAGDFASMYFCTGGPQWHEVREAFVQYLHAERRAEAAARE
jgi:hypothetical protein